MKHTYRFLGKPLKTNLWQIGDENEVFHLCKVLKLPLGSTLEVTDLNGQHIVGTYSEYIPSEKICLIKPIELISTPEPSNNIHIAIGALKPGQIDEILASLVELSIDRISIFNQKDTPVKHMKEKKTQERWERIIMAAIKQCKRSRAPKLNLFPDLSSFLASLEPTLTENKFFLDSEGSLEKFPSLKKSEKFVFVIGSERGLHGQEVDLLLSKNFTGLSLGQHILRAQTATVALAALTLILR